MISEKTALALDRIRTDGGTQPRASLDLTHLARIAEAMQDGADIPPIIVFYDGSEYWLADGFHRYHAAQEVGRQDIAADIRQGTRRDAILYSFGANAEHGLPRNNDDKRRVVTTMLKDPEWATWPQTKIAQHCRVTPEYVSRLKTTLSIDRSIDGVQQVEVTRNGTTYTMSTANIRRSQPQEDAPSGLIHFAQTHHSEAGEEQRAPTWSGLIPPSEEDMKVLEARAIEQVKQGLRRAGIDPDTVDWDAPVENDDEDEEEEYEQTEQDRYMTAVDTGTVDIYYDDLRREAFRRDEEERIAKRTGVPAALQMSESNEWYTPAQYVDAARELMGGIDIDPASNDYANAKVIHAVTYYDMTTNGLAQEWHGRVWLNPPYGRDGGESNQEIWSQRLLQQVEGGITTEAVLLVNAVTDRKWFQPLWKYPICFTDHRIRFYNQETDAGQPTHGNALVYFGPDTKLERFIELFSQFGPIALARRKACL